MENYNMPPIDAHPITNTYDMKFGDYMKGLPEAQAYRGQSNQSSSGFADMFNPLNLMYQLMSSYSTGNNTGAMLPATDYKGAQSSTLPVNATYKTEDKNLPATQGANPLSAIIKYSMDIQPQYDADRAKAHTELGQLNARSMSVKMSIELNFNSSTFTKNTTHKE